MLTRVIHKDSDIEFKDWFAETRDILIPLEELGIWGQTKEWTDRFEISLQLLQTTAVVTTFDVYFVYMHFVLDEQHAKAQFKYLNR